MEKFLVFAGGTVGVLLAACLVVLLGPLFGGVMGWIVGLFFGETILGVLAAFGVKGITMWQFGAFLGFVCAFFKTPSTEKS